MSTTEVQPEDRVVFGPLDHAARIELEDLLPAEGIAPEALAEGPEALLAGAQGSSGDTQGWDTVFAIRLTDMNKTLEKGGVSPESWSIDLGGGFAGSGTFDPWTVARGGSAAILRMSAPLKTGSVTSGEGTWQLAGGTVYFQVELTYIPQSDATETKGHNDLKVKTTATGKLPVVVVEEVDYGPNPEPSTIGKALVKGALEEWFNQHIGDFQHVFTTVNLAAQADKEAFEWMMPTYTSYAYLDGEDLDSSFFGVLCMAEKHDPGTNPPQLSPGAIPEGARAGFSISQSGFLRRMVLPGIAASFPKPEDEKAYFELTNLEEEIVNTREVPLHSVKVGAIYYHPKLEEFDLRVQGEVLQIHAKVHTNISPGIDAYTESTSFKKIALAPQSSGSNTLTFVDAQPADVSHWTNTAKGITITLAVVAIIGAIAGALIGWIGATALFITTAVIVALLFGIAAVVPTLIEKFIGGGANDELPPIDELVLNPTTAIKWPGAGIFDVTSVVLNGALLFGGDPNFD